MICQTCEEIPHCFFNSRSGADSDERAQAVQQRERRQLSVKDHDGAQEGQEVAADEADGEPDEPLLEGQRGAHGAHLVRQSGLL